MIHQHIFAAPKPGMSEMNFKDYWSNLHARRYAIKIPQISKYRPNLRLSCSSDPTPIWSECAEIWLRNDVEQIASLQTPEFLQGARLDEPNWSAFWLSAVLDCETQRLLDGADRRALRFFVFDVGTMWGKSYLEYLALTVAPEALGANFIGNA